MTRSRTLRTIFGIACIIAALCAFGWLVVQFVPGTPRTANFTVDNYGSTIAAAGNSRYTAETIVDSAYGQTYTAEGITRGKWFSTTEEERATGTDEERARYQSYDIDGVEITPGTTKAVTTEAFAEWYPHYAETTGGMEALQHESKVILTEVTLVNTTEHAQYLPHLGLWSEDFNGANNVLDNSAGSDAGYLLEELYGVPSESGLVQNHLPDSWSVLQPGETRTITLPCLVNKALFKNPAAFDEIDPTRFCLTLSDYDPPTIYRLWLG